MSPPDPPPASATERVDRLERRVRWLTTVSLVTALGFPIMLAWQLYPRRHTRDSTQFVIRDRQGTRRVELGMRDDRGPMLRLNNADGRARAALFLGDDGSTSLRLLDRRGAKRAELRVADDGTPGLLLLDREGRILVNLSVDEDGRGTIALRDSARGTIWTAPRP